MMAPDQTRVPLVVPGSRPELQALEARIMAERGRISLLYQVLLNSAPIAQGWEAMLTAVRNRSGVPADLRELAILRVAVLNRARFEFEAHVPHALNAGVTPAQIGALHDTVLPPVFSEAQQQVLALTDHMTLHVEVPNDLMDALNRRYSPTLVVELVATVAAYNMVSRFLVALHVGH